MKKSMMLGDLALDPTILERMTFYDGYNERPGALIVGVAFNGRLDSRTVTITYADGSTFDAAPTLDVVPTHVSS